MSRPYVQEEFREQIDSAQGEKELLALAFSNEGSVKAGFISPEQYAENCIILTRKLGYPITSENLKAAADRILSRATN